MPRLTGFIHGLPVFEEALAASGSETAQVVVPSFAHAYLTAAFLSRRPWSEGPVLVIAPDQDAAEELEHELGLYLPERRVVYLPPRGVWHGSEGEVKPRVAGRRARALAALEGLAPVLIVEAATMLEAVIEPLADPLTVGVGAHAEFEELTRRLAGAGYTRVDQVEDAGEFSVRGGIIDVFPATARVPVRMEFWGDEVDNLRSFSVFSQRSLGPLESIELYAAAEQPDGERRSIASLLPAETRVVQVDPARARARVEAFEADLADLLGSDHGPGADEIGRSYVDWDAVAAAVAGRGGRASRSRHSLRWRGALPP